MYIPHCHRHFCPNQKTQGHNTARSLKMWHYSIRYSTYMESKRQSFVVSEVDNRLTVRYTEDGHNSARYIMRAESKYSDMLQP